MTHVRLVFGNDEGESAHYDCERLSIAAHLVEVGDFFACPHTGFVHVHEVEIVEGVVYLTDCNGHAHLYSLHATMEVARPVPEAMGDA